MNISLFIPCFIDQFYPNVGISMVRVLERLGHHVDFPESQICCGQPAFNSGYWDQAREVAGSFLDAFADAEVIVSPSGSCTTMARRFYAELFKGHPREIEAARVAGRCHELTEFLVRKLGVTDLGARFESKVTWHDSCHTLRELGIKSEPRQLLDAVKGLCLLEMSTSENCCGFGGTFAVKFPDISVAMGADKVTAIEASGADYVSSCDSSCLMQIGGLLEKRGSRIKPIHIAEILAAR